MGRGVWGGIVSFISLVLEWKSARRTTILFIGLLLTLLTQGRLIFLAGLGHAIWVYRSGSGGRTGGLEAVPGGQEGDNREREPLLAQQRQEEGG